MPDNFTIHSLLRRVIDYVYSLKDIRRLGLAIFMVVVFLVSWSSLKAIDTNYELQKQISLLHQQKDVQQLKNNNLKLQNQYFNSDQYLELSARQNFGLAFKGEKEVIVPKDVALSYTVDSPTIQDNEALSASSQQSRYVHNFQAWVNFFLHRQPDTN